MHGSKVWGAYQAGEIGKIRAYCETDTLNTYLIYQRFELMRGNLTAQGYARECEQVRQYLEKSDLSHLQEYLQKWPDDDSGD
jgi:predicted PolB exonuclease-like 3'-5' exonuclease